MSKHFATIRGLAIAALAASLMACGSIQGASSGAGNQIEIPRGDAHLTEFGPSDSTSSTTQDALQRAIELDQLNEKQRLAAQGTTERVTYFADEGQYCLFGPAMQCLVP